MANLKEIRLRLNSVKSTRQITSAMKMVSAAKLRKAQDSVLQLRPFYDKLHEILLNVSQNVDDNYENAFMTRNDEGRILFVVITSNRGLCGAFNSNIVKRAIQTIHENFAGEFQQGKLDIITVGKKGADLLKVKGFKTVASYHHLFDKLTYDTIAQLADSIMADYNKGGYGIVKLFYNKFRNAAFQEITEDFFLPMAFEKGMVDKYESHFDFIFEPSNVGIMEEMIPQFLRVQLFKSMLESNASEHGARMTAMHKATDNATDLIKELELTYNKARQASITKEILEIVGGAEALKA